MKKIYVMMAILAVAALSGCKKDSTPAEEQGGNNPSSGLTAPVLTANATSVVLQEASAASGSSHKRT